MHSFLAAVVAIVGATVYTGNGPALQDATVVIKGELIQSVGSSATVPSDARVIDGKGMTVTPGLIDAYSRVGLVEISQETTSVEGTAGAEGDPVRAALRVADTFNPASQLIEDARKDGITSVMGVPIDGVISGQSAWFEFGEAPRVLESPTALHVGLDTGGEERGSRSRKILTLRRALEDASLYRSDPGAFKRRGLRDLSVSAADLAVLSQALGGSLPVVFAVDRAADIRTALAIAKEYELWAVLVGVAEGWVVADEIAAAKVPALVDPFSNLPRDYDALEARADNAALLHQAGVVVAFTLQGDAHKAGRLRQAAGIAVANGIPHAAAVAAITRVPADIFGNTEVGSLRRGARANLVVWTGDPLELSTWAQHVFVGGSEIDGKTRKDLLTERYAP